MTEISCNKNIMEENKKLKEALSATIQQLQSLYDIFLNEKSQSEDTQKSISEKLIHVKNCIDDLENQLDAKDNENSELKVKINNLNDEKLSLNSELKIIEEQYNEESKRFCEFRARFDELMEICETIENKNNENDVKLKLMQKENEKLKRSLNERQKCYNDLTSEVEAYKLQLVTYEEDIKNMEKEREEFHKVIDRLKLESQAKVPPSRQISYISQEQKPSTPSTPSISAQKNKVEERNSLTPSDNPTSNERNKGDSSYVCPKCQCAFIDLESYLSHVNSRCS